MKRIVSEMEREGGERGGGGGGEGGGDGGEKEEEEEWNKLWLKHICGETLQ